MKVLYYILASPAFVVGILALICKQGYQQGNDYCYKLWTKVGF